MDQAYCDALRFAMEYERKGEEHYRSAAAAAKDHFAKQALTFLADEEIEHIRKIDEFNQHMLGIGDFDIDAECQLGLSSRVEDFLETAKGATSEEDRRLTEIDVYDQAMENEKHGYEMYASVETGTQNESLKQFFAFLAQEEKAHYNLLEASKKYLQDPSYYFEEGGGWLFG